MNKKSLSSRDYRYIELAYRSAQESSLNNFWLGACLHLRKKDYVCGSANPRSKVGRYSLTSIHAEMDALLRSGIRLKNPKHATMYVVRISVRGELRNAKPCAHCMALLASCNVQSCCWSTGEREEPFRKTLLKNAGQGYLNNRQNRFLLLESYKGIPLFI